jgi:ergothioneine biosynthesis protein EgtB
MAFLDTAAAKLTSPNVESSQRSDDERDRVATLEQFRSVRGWTDKIIEPLEVEDMVVQTSTECSPTKWQLGHTTWFFETFVLASVRSYGLYDDQYGFLFNSYYNSIGDRVARPIRGLLSRPTVAEIREYRSYVDTAIERAILTEDNDWWSATRPIIELGLHHEQQHQELMVTDVKTVLAISPQNPVYRTREIQSGSIPALGWRSFDGGLVAIGYHGQNFSFDNEGPQHKVFLEPYTLADRLVTNGEYIEFIEAGGYRDPRFWLSDGWAKVLEEGWIAPKYWQDIGGQWWMMTLQGLRRVEPSEPVTHVSHYEADAFATWAGARLPTEFEWEHAAAGISVRGNFLESMNFHPRPLTEPTEPMSQMYGDVWEWTRSAYLPYPGYTVAAGALGEYNGKFMSNQMVLRGGSCVTPESHIRSTYRNFFPPESRWQFSGIRLARNVI